MNPINRFFLSILVVAPMGVAQAGLLDDPSFELATDGSTNSNSNWVLSTNMPDGVSSSASFSQSIWAASDGDTGVWFKPFEGNQSAGDATANAELSQVVPAVADSGDYLLTFDSARETNFSASELTAMLSSDSGAMVSLDLLSATYNDGGNMNSNPTMFSLLLPGVLIGESLTVSVKMVDGVDAQANPQSLMVDNFSLTRQSVPDAGPTLALLAPVFLGLLGAQARARTRRRRI